MAAFWHLSNKVIGPDTIKLMLRVILHYVDFMQNLKRVKHNFTACICLEKRTLDGLTTLL